MSLLKGMYLFRYDPSREKQKQILKYSEGVLQEPTERGKKAHNTRNKTSLGKIHRRNKNK